MGTIRSGFRRGLTRATGARAQPEHHARQGNRLRLPAIFPRRVAFGRAPQGQIQLQSTLLLTLQVPRPPARPLLRQVQQRQ